MDDILGEFIAETNEGIELLDGELVRLEQNPDDPELISHIFRVLHTIKGTCGFLGLPRLAALAHAGENVLGQFRDGSITVTPTAMNPVLEALDRIRSFVATLEETGEEPSGNDSDLIEELNRVAKGEDAGVKLASDEETERNGQHTQEDLYTRIGGLSSIDMAVEIFYERLLDDDRVKEYFTDVNMDRLQGMQRAFLSMVLGGPDEYEGRDLRAAHEHLVEKGLNDEHFDVVAAHLLGSLVELDVPEDVVKAMATKLESTRSDVLNKPSDPIEVTEEVHANQESQNVDEPSKPQTPSGGESKKASARTIRVNVDVLESLMTVVSELVLTRNQLMQILRAQKESEFASPLQRLNQVTSELQESVMQTRMQPIGNAWSKLPRIVRDLAQELDKKIDLVMKGAETELDRQVLDEIKDPLTHMVRNAADHGLETTEERRTAGKSETGNIILNARHEGGHIILEVSDDGHGLDTDRIRDKILKNGLATESEIENLSEQQIQQFIFKPGFSTATNVTNVSGRGVGMDVVRSNIGKIGGTVELSSSAGKGTKFTIKIPLTLAIISALIVESGGQRFALPQNSVIELVRITSNSTHKIEMVKGTPVLRLRDRLLSLVNLKSLLEIENQGSQNETYVIVTQVGTQMFGIVVDRVFDTEEIVVKPVAEALRNLPIYSGNTILGDGSVIMILDPIGIANVNGVSTSGEDSYEESTEDMAHLREKTSMLIFKAGQGAPKAVPLALVSRIEDISLDDVENAGGQPAVQYRDQLMPLVTLTKDQQPFKESKQPVLAFSDRGRSVGLVTDEIIDIVETDVSVEMKTESNGLIGTAIIGGTATDLIDTTHFLGQACDDWFDVQRESSFGDTGEKHILLVDDSSFFRNLLTPILESAGYKVTQADNGANGLEICQSGESFDLIISDLEMPIMDGFGFVSHVRKETQFEETPIIALSSHASPEDIARCMEAGFTSHVEKLNRETFLSRLKECFAERRKAA